MALNALMKACGLSGESGPEAMFDILRCAVSEVDAEWYVVDQSHFHGQCYDVNALLAQKIQQHAKQNRQAKEH